MIDEYTLRGEDDALSDAERRIVLGRVSGGESFPQSSVLDIARVVARRRASEWRHANEVYESALSGYVAAGMDPQRAHSEAIAQVYRAANAQRLGLAPPKVTPADRRAGLE